MIAFDQKSTGGGENLMFMLGHFVSPDELNCITLVTYCQS